MKTTWLTALALAALLVLTPVLAVGQAPSTRTEAAYENTLVLITPSNTFSLKAVASAFKESLQELSSRVEYEACGTAELNENRIYWYGSKANDLLSYSSFNYIGIVYILPSEASSPYWKETFGDRVYFYAKSDLRTYKDFIKKDFETISSAGYDFVIVVVPLSNTQLFKMNAQLINEIALLENLSVLYAIFPKWEYGNEWDYLTPGSSVNSAFLSVASFLLNLNSTMGVAVWYGWEGRVMDPKELESFYLSLPTALRRNLWLWIDQPFVERANSSGIINVVNELNITLVTELYTPTMLASYQSLARKQMIVTGYWNANSVSEWVNGIKSKLGLVNTSGRILGIWIFWDENDGHGEAYRAYIGGELRNPVFETPSILQYYVSVKSEYGEVKGTGLYRRGKLAVVEVSPLVIDYQNQTKREFSGWYEDGNLVSKEGRFAFIVQSNRSLTAKWNTLYQVSVISERGNAQGSGWYERGSEAKVSIAPVEIQQDLITNWVFEGWEINGKIVSTEPEYALRVNEPVTIKAVWRQETNSVIFFGAAVLIFAARSILLRRLASTCGLGPFSSRSPISIIMLSGPSCLKDCNLLDVKFFNTFKYVKPWPASGSICVFS